DRLYQGQKLHAGEFLISPNHQWELKLGDTSQLELWSLACGCTIWVGGREDSNSGYALMTVGGEINLFNGSGQGIGGTDNQEPGDYFIVSDGGGVNIFTNNGALIWNRINGDIVTF